MKKLLLILTLAIVGQSVIASELWARKDTKEEKKAKKKKHEHTKEIKKKGVWERVQIFLGMKDEEPVGFGPACSSDKDCENGICCKPNVPGDPCFCAPIGTSCTHC